MTLIDGLNQTGISVSMGVTADTNAVRRAMTELALKCANATMAYARSIKNNTLAALVDFVQDDLDRKKKDEALKQQGVDTSLFQLQRQDTCGEIF